ncbi:MAG: sensor histidine kinase [Planctomycetota bacterium]|nr:MAG: sensor histidine kinase [Planctomycetota bacterium]
MKLAHKLAALLVLGNCAVLFAYGLLARQREASMFERSMERDTFLAGETLLDTIEQTWASEGQEAALELIAQASRRQEDMEFRWLGPAKLAAAGVSSSAWETSGASEPVVRREGDIFRIYIPYAPPRGAPGALEVSQDMRPDEAYVRSSTFLLVGAALASALVSGGLAFGIGEVLVGRPMQLLIRRIERVGAGHLSGRLELGRTDEIGAVARALDRMATDLERAQAKAAEEAAERRAALNQLRHAERLATVGRLAAGIAHELGTPLNVVLARAKLLQKNGEDAHKVRRHAEVIVAQTQRMTQIIRQLLDFARRREAERRPADLRSIAETVVEALAPLARKRGVSLELAGVAKAVACVDPGQFEQVLTNLVMNALQASPPGAPVVVALRRVLDTPPPEHDRPPGPHWCIEVRDRGPGIPEEHRERIFEPFFTTKDVGEGTGLGLTVAHGIVAEHDGWIVVDSPSDGGACFRVFLPAEKDDEGVEAATAVANATEEAP